MEEDKKGTMSKTEILLFSGGVDSYVAWLKLGRPPTIHFMGVSRLEKKENRSLSGNGFLIGWMMGLLTWTLLGCT